MCPSVDAVAVPASLSYIPVSHPVQEIKIIFEEKKQFNLSTEPN